MALIVSVSHTYLLIVILGLPDIKREALPAPLPLDRGIQIDGGGTAFGCGNGTEQERLF